MILGKLCKIMKKLIEFTALFLAVIISLQFLTACNLQPTENVGQAIPSVTTQPTGNITPTTNPSPKMGKISVDFLTARSLEDLVARSTVIVTGQIESLAETINNARNPNKPEEPDPNLLILGQVYNFKVEGYLKGKGENTLKVVQREAYLDTKTFPATKENIEAARAVYPYIAFNIGTKYLLFLDFYPSTGERAGKNYLGGVREPWRFTVPDNSNAQAESPAYNITSTFPSKSTAILIKEVEEVINKNPTIPSPTPAPSYTPVPWASVKVGQNINPIQLYGVDKVTAIRIKMSGPRKDPSQNSAQIKAVVDLLNKVVVVLDEKLQPQITSDDDIVFIIFDLESGKTVGFEYNRKTGTLKLPPPNPVYIQAPPNLLQLLGIN
jgi:hypothetical protein